MHQHEYDREMRAIRTAVLADRAEYLTCFVLALVVVLLLILPVAGLLASLLAHLQAVLAALPR